MEDDPDKKDFCFTGFAAADRCTVFLKDIDAQSINFPRLSVSQAAIPLACKQHQAVNNMCVLLLKAEVHGDWFRSVEIGGISFLDCRQNPNMVRAMPMKNGGLHKFNLCI